MSDAPERIFAGTYYGEVAAGYWHDVNDVFNGVAYIRADAAEAKLAAARDGLKVYAGGCDEGEITICRYEGNLCCKTARATLARIGGEG